MLESTIQAKIIRRLEASGWIVNKVISCSNPGWTDLEAFRSKVAVFIETKVPGRKPESLQLYRHKKLREQGFEVIVATDINDVKHLCN